MKKVVINYLVIAVLTLSAAFTSCNKDEDEWEMTMTRVMHGQVRLIMTGSSNCRIDCGDGSEIEEYAFSGEEDFFYHFYTVATFHTITISGRDITSLDCYGNQLKSLDVSKNPALKILNCMSNQIKNLDVSKNTALIQLNCCHNQLKSLDVNTALMELWCGGNQLTSLDVSKNIVLKELFCWDNQITKLDVSKNTALEDLDCSENKLEAAALNALFESLNSNEGVKNIDISDNPGTNSCDQSIATKKGWQVADNY